MSAPERAIREEGAAARILGVPRSSNPYAEAALAEVVPPEWASAWKCGWVQGRRLPEERRAAREQLEAIAAIFSAERKARRGLKFWRGWSISQV